MNRAERLQELLRLEGLITAAKERVGEHRVALNAEATGEYEREGMAPTWRWPDLGTVILPVSKETVVVADPAAVLAWVKERHPSEVEHIEQVRPSFMVALLQRLAPAADIVVDPTTGEMVPGLAVRAGGVPKALSIRPTPAASELFTAVGRQALEEMLAPAEPVGHLEAAEIPGGAE
jgi:hypothetical protein